MMNVTITLLAVLAIPAGAVGLYFLGRALFVRAADRVSSVLNRVADTPAAANAGRAATSMAGRGIAFATPWIRYLRTQGLDEADARQEFSRRIERLARLLDSAVTLPVFGPVGLDALLGLFPFVGDATSAAVALSLVSRSLKYGIPRKLITKMLANVLVDLLLGAVPVVGDVADIWYRANRRNVKLLKEYLEQTRDVP